ncbi:MAG: hypothetical protein FD176_316 [Rhodospirillaceae bacterium]|nr:MAG: hypothetical protein FD176_316 [Rhodospirillaceae bacterium]TNC97435.1 MAG: hypothetical protein FD119_1035 [Stygiobacter sp.]
MSGSVFSVAAPWLGAGIGLIVFAGMARAVGKRGGLVDDRRVVPAVAVVALISLSIFWSLGPNSYVTFGDEGEYVIPFVHWLATYHDGGRFAHALLGGVDVYALEIAGLQYFYPERLLMTVLPVWGVLALHKTALFLLGYSGTYLLCRRLGATRLWSAALALFYLSTPLRGDDTFSQGMVSFVLPYVLLVFTQLIQSRWFFAAVALVAVPACTLAPVHTFPAVPITALAGWVMLSRQRPGRLLAGLSAMVAVEAVNWSEILYASIVLAPHSLRGAAQDQGQGSLWAHLDYIRATVTTIFAPTWSMVVVWLCGLGLLIWKRTHSLVWVLVALLVGVTLPLLPVLPPWDMVGLGFLTRISWGNCVIYGPALALPVLTLAYQQWADSWGAYPLRRALPAVAVLALAVGSLAGQRVAQLGTLVHFGGQSQYHAVANLRQPSWQDAQPMRAVTVIGGAPARNVAAGFYGFDSFDGMFTLYPRAISELYGFGIQKTGRPNFTPEIYWDAAYWDWNSLSLDFDAVVDTTFLRIANVGYVFSSTRLNGVELDLLSGPPTVERVWSTQSNAQEKLAYYQHRWRSIFVPQDAFVYALKDPLPRIYAATAIHWLKESGSPRAAMAEIRQHAPARRAVLDPRYRSDLASLGDGVPTVTGFTLVRDGIDIELQAPKGGLVVVNTPFMPFWQGWADAGGVTLVPANHVAMAVAVPPGTRRVALRYCRPLLREQIAAWAFKADPVCTRSPFPLSSVDTGVTK